MKFPKKFIVSVFALLLFSISAFSMEIKTFEENNDKYSVKIQFLEEMGQAKFILTMPQALFERSKAFNLMNEKIRTFQTEQYFSSYSRICDDTIRYNNKEKTVAYIADIQFKNRVSGIIEEDF